MMNQLKMGELNDCMNMISNNTLPEPSFLHFLCIFARLFSRGCLSIALKVLIVPKVARINSRCKTEASQLKSSLVQAIQAGFQKSTALSFHPLIDF